MRGAARWGYVVLLCSLPTCASSVWASDTFKAEGGVFGAREGRGAFYYRVIYQGASLAEYGEARVDSNSHVGRLSVPALESPAGTELSVQFERGHLDVGGDLLAATGLKPLGQYIPRLGRLRGSAQAFARMDGQATQYALGLETPPMHPLALFGAERLSVMNRMMFGVQAERRDADGASSSVQEGGVAQARWYVGKAWGDAKPLDSQVKEREVIRARLFAGAKNLDDAEKWIEREKLAETTNVGTPWFSLLEQIVLFHRKQWSKLADAEAKRLGKSADEWRKIVDAIAEPANIPSNHTRIVLGYEGSVRREFGDHRISDAWLPFMRAEFKWWPLPQSPEAGWFTLAYVNGFDRADRSGKRRDQVLASFGVEF